MHDAHEAYLGDITTPLKLQLSAGTNDGFDFDEYEFRIWTHVAGSFGISQEDATLQPAEVTTADRRMVSTEVRDLFRDKPVDNWTSHFGLPYDDVSVIVPWSCKVAEARFLMKFGELYAAYQSPDKCLERRYLKT